MQIETILITMMIIAIIFFILFFIGKLFKSFCFAVIIIVFIGVTFTLFFGNGTEIVRSISLIMDDESGTKIQEIYKYYKEKEGPSLNLERISQYITNEFEQVTEKAEELFFD